MQSAKLLRFVLGITFVFVLVSGNFVAQAEEIEQATSWESSSVDISELESDDAPVDDNSIWLDQEVLKYYLGSLSEWGGQGGAGLLDHVKTAQLQRGEQALTVNVFSDQDLNISLQVPGVAIRTGQPYRVMIPKLFSFTMNVKNDVLRIRPIPGQPYLVKLRINIPLISDTVYLRKISADLATGRVKIEAGAISNRLAVIARANMKTKSFQGLDFWATFARSLHFR
jgi:hypothetical protein